MANNPNTKSFNKKIVTLLEKWGASIDSEMLILALTHRSFANEVGGMPNNERLEFLGDSILGIIVTEKLYRDFPDVPEGKLANMRAATVSQSALASVARKINLGKYILLGKGEIVTNGNEKDSILSDTVEALIGATYLCNGLEITRKVVEDLLSELLRDVLVRSEQTDWKTTLQEMVSARVKSAMPVYTVEGTGPNHNRTFFAEVVVDNLVYGSGQGTSKKMAEQNAARMATLSMQASEEKTDK
ncbi:ribonuclease III [Actinomyces sp. zg-332]|uniref:ribonuclease III n=1 Tax=Actinomyces sp. zg-332 TaxID=2708340 RepID=UPI00141F1484|nr:ribonuclease III [Actinomyces sp. zg-332]QPK94450.1 ribonuclease III [Actinomyces sp. zg-332]